MKCPKCNSPAFRRKGVHFDHEYLCAHCDHIWEPISSVMTEQSEEKTEPTHDDGESIVCPLCGEAWADLWDYEWSNADCIETECPYCEAKITLCASYSVSYTCHPGWK